MGVNAEENTAFTGPQWAGAVVKGTWVSATGNCTVPTVSQPTEAPGTSGGWNGRAVYSRRRLTGSIYGGGMS
jgi:hypothetical protein